MKILYFIPARSGSKRFPGKNIYVYKKLPLFMHSINHARYFTDDENICLSTDSELIKNLAEGYRLPVKFLRPSGLSTDDSPTRDAILHALEYYPGYEAVMLLQPTSPDRSTDDIKTAIMMYSETVFQYGKCDAVFSSIDRKIPNGLVCLINIESLKKYDIMQMKNIITFTTKNNLDINYEYDIPVSE
jgi:CMP-N-acetylneuraminic acid synthetase